MEKRFDLCHDMSMNHSILGAIFRKCGGFVHALLLVSTLALLLSACGGNQAQQPPTPTQTPWPLPPIGGLPPAAAGLPPTGQLAPDTQLELIIGLLTNRQALENDLAAIYDPDSVQYGQYLTPQQVADRYGASQAIIDKVSAFLQAQGFQIEAVSPLRDSITVSATVAQIAQTFQVTLLTFQDNGRTFFGPSSTVTLPAALQGLVTNVYGLNNFAQLTHAPLPSSASEQSAPEQPAAADCSGVDKNALSPNQIAAVYNYTGLYKAGYKGKGITIGFLGARDANLPLSEVTTFLACTTHTQLHYSLVKVDGGATTSDGLLETEMSVEFLAALAPDAQIIEYQGNQYMLPILNKVAADGKVQVFSSDWSASSEDGLTKSDADIYDQTIKRMAAEGITFANDTYDCAAYGSKVYGILGVDFPTSDPYVLAVGGTYLKLDDKGKRSLETVWNTYPQSQDKHICQHNDWGSGGGISTLIKQPRWQTGPGVKNKYSNGNRELPDVSAVAWNVSIYSLPEGWTWCLGTSASTPIWAAGIALVDQALLKHHKKPVGATPAFYQVANKHGKYHPYYDVTKGNNLEYPATAGYDLTSGWGAPNLLDFAKALGAF